MTSPSSENPNEQHDAEEHLSVMQRRWRKFKSIKRGWYSFLLLTTLYVVSLFNPLLVNSRPLMVSHEGETYYPALAHWVTDEVHAGTTFGQRVIGEARYRELRDDWEEEGSDSWMVMPLYEFDPYEALLREADLVGPPPHAPNAYHWMGTDDRGRDVFARLVYGFRISITFALITVGLSYLIGMTIGSILGFFGGRVDIYGQRFVEIWAAVPFLYTVIIINSIYKPGVLGLALVLAAFSWVGISYYMRGEFYREKAKDYVAAALAQGESKTSIMFQQILPNALTPVISFAPFAIVGSISALVSLDFLGFGLQPPDPSWGELVGQGKANIFEWHLVTYPLGALFVTLMLIVFIGEAVREAFDPKVFARLR